MSENRAAFRIIEAADTPMGIGPGDLALTIAWPDGEETVEHVSERAAAALGYQRPSEPPAPPAWMVEVAREAMINNAISSGLHGQVDGIRAGEQDRSLDAITAIRALRLALERGHVVEPRELTEEDLLKAAREDAAQTRGHYKYGAPLISATRNGHCDDSDHVQAALQARRNMLREGAVATAPVRDRDGNPPAYALGTHIQKVTGDYQISGIVRGVILTGAGLWRYAVEHQAEGGGAFLHIYAGANLATLPTQED